jgi:NAD(P)-dependent dehydrogenase (short-subunit alcohol dehydrogenase family)
MTEMSTAAPASHPKTVLITGASTGIGKATAEYFAARGWNVAATMRTPANATFDGAGAERIKVIRLDVTDDASIATAVAETIGAFGRIDALVNNAGYGLIGLFEAMTADQVRRQFETNVLGLMSVTRAVIPQMRAQASGRIINVASVAGRMSMPLYSLYCSTKWAVEGFSEALNYELNSVGVQVRIIEPGPILTDFMTRSLDVADKDISASYGDFEARVWEAYKVEFADAPGPELVAASIFKAATTSSNWRLRFKPNGWLLMFGRRCVTTSTHTKIVARVLGAVPPILPWNRRRFERQSTRQLHRSQP